ncbi:MAG TPA: hypothetical protein VG897_15110 [Terriglobales bacterium]|nr:hypothetical protein [Terriglobales bacterium]
MAAPVRSSPAYASLLRLELCERNRKFASAHGLPFDLSYGSSPVVVYSPCGMLHGNFFPESYAAIQMNPAWKKRLSKVHTSDSLPRTERRWCELDSCNSSDALLMNIFCCPETLSDRLQFLLGIEPAEPEFGLKARVPLLEGKFDRTEVDMRIGNLLVEAKLTEADFQTKPKEFVQRYRDFEKVFRRGDLPQSKTSYVSYQLIRNVLAAYALDCSFCVMLDARRPDLIEQWYAVMRCVKDADLRVRCKVLTWQELSEVLPEELREFLDEKYGIRPGPIVPYEFDHLRE